MSSSQKAKRQCEVMGVSEQDLGRACAAPSVLSLPEDPGGHVHHEAEPAAAFGVDLGCHPATRAVGPPRGDAGARGGRAGVPAGGGRGSFVLGVGDTWAAARPAAGPALPAEHDAREDGPVADGPTSVSSACSGSPVTVTGRDSGATARPETVQTFHVPRSAWPGGRSLPGTPCTSVPEPGPPARRLPLPPTAVHPVPWVLR